MATSTDHAQAVQLRRMAAVELGKATRATGQGYQVSAAFHIAQRTRYLHEAMTLDPEGHARWQRRQRPLRMGELDLDNATACAAFLQDVAEWMLLQLDSFMECGAVRGARLYLTMHRAIVCAAALLDPAKGPPPAQQSGRTGRC